MDRLDAMLVFQTAVEAGSLSAAGRELGMPLATVSRKISESRRPPEDAAPASLDEAA